MGLQPERHYANRMGWLRAAVLGANDGIVSTASLVIGVAAANSAQADILIAGTAGMVAGAMSMAAGEYVSVSSQADTARADLAREQRELEENDAYEHQELADIYVGRGLDPELAREVAMQLMAHDALTAHARDELGLSDTAKPRPLQAALTSALTFSIGAAVPLLIVAFSPRPALVTATAAASLSCLTVMGGLAARSGGAPVAWGAARVTFWGALAMAATAAVGSLFGTPA